MTNCRRKGALGALVALILGVCLATVPTAGQAPEKPGPAHTNTAGWYTPKTAWGDPNLQGLWTEWDQTPLEARSSAPTEAEGEAGDGASSRPADGNTGGGLTFTYQGKDYKYTGLGSGMGREYPGPRSDRRQALVVDPENGIVPIIKSAVQRTPRRAIFDTWETHGAWTRCISMGVPGRLLSGAPNNGYNKAYQIFQSPGYVAIFHEMLHETRIIPVNGRPHVNAEVKQWQGDSIGHWDGQTLVVETTNFNGKGQGQPTSVPATQALQVVERFTRVDEKTLKYETTLEDPNVYTKKWSAMQYHNMDPDYTILEYACHEGNGRYMEGTLTRGRILDAEEAAKKSTAARPASARPAATQR